ncbi:hypothetical protein UNDYM_5925 (plasmid) [Undibacterium sp. YM2]|uniref:amidohydrolase family protein n=1 Tax=Undibacterium sp. YM2 TaxID=2058625 RepID=UPI001331D947|nr:amidohydrolase family protein [Undibacterium sp. YM2]BBB70178.1 hypothetical protein UNDYM_5925 [Undibacterium sp. YM2]
MPTLPNKIVDLHTHLFNARCLPLPGIFANALNKDADNSWVARHLSTIIFKITESEYSPENLQENFLVDTDYVDRLSDTIEAHIVGEIEARNVQFRELADQEKHPLVVAHDITQDLKNLQKALIDEYENNQDCEIREAVTSLKEVPENLQFTKQSFSGWIEMIIGVAIRILNKEQDVADDIENYGAFIYSMLSAEKHMAETLIERYGVIAPDYPPITLVHHMMDMQMAYVVKPDTTQEMVSPYYPFYCEYVQQEDENNGDQISRMKQVHAQYPQTIGFLAFDPRRENCMDVFKFVQNGEFKGFKFYTSMGYLPANDPVAEIRDRVHTFFEKCAALDIPVFTHCTAQGFQTRAKLGLNAKPKNWDAVLEAFPKLRLCFGHAGGGKQTHVTSKDTGGKVDLISLGWSATKDEWNGPDDYVIKGVTYYNFAKDVVRLCRTYENVYCEFAYITDLIEGHGDECAKARACLVDNLVYVIHESQAVEAPYKFENKMAFGSDWNMPSMVTHPKQYLQVFLEIFDAGGPLANYREQFFHENALNYMKAQ